MGAATVSKIKQMLDPLPIASTLGGVVQWLQSWNMLDKDPIFPLSQLREFHKFNEATIATITSVIKLVLRTGVAVKILPYVASVLSLYNGSVGVCYLGIGSFNYLRKSENNETAKELHRGFTYILTAVYDFAIGYFFGTPTLGLIAGAAIFGFMPHHILDGHHWIFQTLQKAPDALENKPDSEGKKTYHELDPECQIYQLAKRITLGLLPSASTEEKSFVMRCTSWCNRFIGRERAVENYGL